MTLAFAQVPQIPGRKKIATVNTEQQAACPGSGFASPSATPTISRLPVQSTKQSWTIENQGVRI